MSDEPKIRSLNQGIAAELELEALEPRLELSPIGVLDLLLTDPDLGEVSSDDNCKKDNVCGSDSNCNERNNSDGCGVDGKPRDDCPSLEFCNEYGCSSQA